MKDITLFGTCTKCKRKGLFLRHREITIPGTGAKAVSKDKMCNNCYIKLLSALKAMTV